MNATDRFEKVHIDRLVPYARNARTHSKEQIRQLRASLREFGFVSPCIIDKDYNIIAGHGRVLAAREEGIEMPLESFNDTALSNLEKMITSKASLIRKALGLDALPIEQTEDRLRFAWFHPSTDGGELDAYARFIVALCTAAKSQKRVTAKEKPVENEKFAFRVFLIRLGMIGDDYKSARKVLLKNLSGNSAFKSGKPVKTEVQVDE